MHSLFPIVMFGAIALFVLLGVLSMLTRSSNLYDQIGQGGLELGERRLGPRPRGASAGGALAEEGLFLDEAPPALDEREQEIRQMLQARSDRLVARGHAPLDIDAEVARLHGPPAGAGGRGGGPGFEAHQDPALVAEIRQLVLARNERRRRQGQPALDVDAEVARALAELGT
jgi:hypothetical protein